MRSTHQPQGVREMKRFILNVAAILTASAVIVIVVIGIAFAVTAAASAQQPWGTPYAPPAPVAAP